jgi:hypothetical protein
MEEVVAHLFSLIFHLFYPSEVDYLVSEQFSFYGVRLLASRPTPNLGDHVIPFRLAPTPWPVRHGCPTSSYATAGIVLRVSGALKPHYHYKVKTPSVGKMKNKRGNFAKMSSLLGSTTIKFKQKWLRVWFIFGKHLQYFESRLGLR